MPYEKNKNEEVRTSNGKKSVTKKSGTASGTTSKAAQTKTQSTRNTSAKSTGTSSRSTSGSQSKPKQTGTNASKPKTSTAMNSRPKQTTSAQSKPKTQNTQSRQTSSAREDYRLFTESAKKSAQSSKTAQAKKTTAQSARRTTSGGTAHKKGKSRSRSKLVSVLTYLMMGFAFAALMVTLSLTVFFKIDSIKVTFSGTEYYSEDSIITLSGIEMGENIFSIPVDEIEADIEENMPYIENCEVKRSFPTGINIKVTSAKPVGIVTLQTGARIIISDEGKSLEMLQPEMSGSDIQQSVSDSDISATDTPQDDDGSDYIDEYMLPSIVGLTITEGMEPGKYIVVEDETAMPILKQLVELLEAYNLPPTKIDLSAGNLYSYYDGRIKIKLGSGSQLETKIKMAHEIILNKLSQYDSGRVDVSGANKGYFTPEYMLD